MSVNIGFLTLIVSAAMGGKTAKCDPDGGPVVPYGFLATFALFTLNWMYVRHLHKKQYNITWAADEKKKQALFEAQTDRYMTKMDFLAKWHLVEILLGMVLAHRNITCIDGGNSWAYRNWKGAVFMTLHLVGTSMATGMIRNVFIKTAKAQNWWAIDADFGDDDELEAAVDKKDK
jgi:hypothetical protein